MDENRTEQSEKIGEITKALCKFQGIVGKVDKGSKNPFFKSSYASLADILNAISGPLQVCELSIIQLPVGSYGLTTIISHSSGEYFSATYYMKPTKDDPQGAGSVITYQRRYAIGAVLSLNIDKDDDGNQGSGLTEQKPATGIPEEAVKQKEQMIEEFTLLYILLEEKGWNPDQTQVEFMNTIKKQRYNAIAKAIDKLREIKKGIEGEIK